MSCEWKSSREDSSDCSCNFHRARYGGAFEKYTLGHKTFLKIRAARDHGFGKPIAARTAEFLKLSPNGRGVMKNYVLAALAICLFVVEPARAGQYSGTPYSGSPVNLPGTVQAEQFD